jgi:hypothetical protein
MDRTRAIAFTDSVHSSVKRMGREYSDWLGRVGCDWVASQLPLDTLVRPVSQAYNDVVNISAGHHKHEYTTGHAGPAIFPFFEAMRQGQHPYL